jgi:alkylation response protein AidB-like acyl-CoA dehydrogenase
MTVTDAPVLDAPGTDAPAGVRQSLPPVDISPERLTALTATLAQNAEAVDRDSLFPWDGIRAVHEAGILTATVPTEFDGHGGLTAVDSARVFQALGAGDPSVALIAAMTVFSHAGVRANDFWPDDLYSRLLRESAAGPTLINAIRAEPELGAPARGGLPATTVRRTASGWVLNGHKGFATGSEGLSYHLVWAVSDDSQLIGHVIVPARDEDGTPNPGIRIERTWDHLGMRGTSTHDVIYTDVEVPFENFRGSPVGSIANNGAPSDGLFLSLSALYLGIGRAAQQFFVRFANERVPTSLGRPIATTDRIRSVAGEIEAQLVQGEQVLYGLARSIDEKRPGALADASLAKLLITRSAITAVETAVAALGNPGLSRHNPLQRHLRDVLCSRVHPPQDDAALLGAGIRSLAL